MRTAITVDPYIPVPPTLYGGIERIVDIVVRGLVARGHEVVLFAHPDSRTGGEIVPYGAPPHFGWRPRLVELRQVGSGLWRRRHEIDVVLSWGRLAALLPILPLRRLPKIQRYCRAGVPWKSVEIAVRIAGESIVFAGASARLYRDRPRKDRFGGHWRTIHDGVEIAKYEFAPSVRRDAPLVFLGRLEFVKGVHNAIAIAKGAKRKLIIAGNKVENPDAAQYFSQWIAPHLDGEQIVWVGQVDDAQKSSLLGSAAALLMPIEWEEPFGIVMAEALACGTPVVGFARGSVPEVVRDGVNGYLCHTVDEAVAAVGRLDRLDRAAVRSDCEARFSDTVVVDAYELLCREVLNR
jgi:glycosyltransferase involved in cell wall biosynthesis